MRETYSLKNRLIILMAFVFAMLMMVGLSVKNVYAAETLPEQTDGVIKLTEDVTLTDTAVIGETITLDLNGYTLYGYKGTQGGRAIRIDEGGSLTLQDSSAEKTGAIRLPDNSGGYAIIVNGGKLSMQGGNIFVSGQDAAAIKPQAKGEAIMEGGSISTDGTKTMGVCLMSYDKSPFTLAGGEISASGSGCMGIYMAGEDQMATIKNGTITVDGEDSYGINTVTFGNYGHKIDVSGGTIKAAGRRSYAVVLESMNQLTVTGGELVSENSDAIVYFSEYNTGNISGGTVIGNGYGDGDGYGVYIKNSAKNKLDISGDPVIAGTIGSINAAENRSKTTPAVVISGGYFNGIVSGGVPSDKTGKYAIYNITGGYFTDEIADSALYNYALAKDYTPETYTDEVKSGEKNILFTSKKTSDGVDYKYTVREKEGYVLMNIPYKEFYKSEVEDNGFDAVTSATKNKGKNIKLSGGSYHSSSASEGAEGVIYPVYFENIKDINNIMEVEAGDDAYASLFEKPAYSYCILTEKPANYKKVTKTDDTYSFGPVQGSKKELEGQAQLIKNDSHADYVIEFSNSEIENSNYVNAVLVRAGNKSYGMAHVNNIWRKTEIGWNKDDNYRGLSSSTVEEVTYYTNKGVYVFNVTLDIPEEPLPLATPTLKFKDIKTIIIGGIPEGAVKATVKIDGILKETNAVNGEMKLSANAKPGQEYKAKFGADNYRFNSVKAEANDVDPDVDAVKNQLNALTETSTAEEVQAARDAYEALTTDQKEKVDATAVEKLETAEKAIKDAQAVAEAEKKMNALTENSSAEEVQAARKAYDALTKEQQAKVNKDVVAKLETVEKAIKDKNATEASTSTTETTATQATTPTSATPAAPAKGQVIKSGNVNYKVTNAATNGKGTVTMVGIQKKTAAINVPATVKYNGVSYKVTAVGAKAFAKNTKATKIVIGANVQAIGASAFANCTKVKTIKIGKNVKKIGKQAFLNEKSVKTITISTKKLTAKTVGAAAFKGTGASKGKKLTVKVPKAKKKAYKKLLVKKGLYKKAKIK